MEQFNRKKIYIYQNEMPNSDEAYAKFVREISERGYEISDKCDTSVGLITCIGGDGTFLRLMHACNFPPNPIIGINTGHLGFFQEIQVGEIASFLDCYEHQEYTLQNIWPVEAIVETEDGRFRHRSINEIAIRGPHTHLTHLEIEMDGSPMQEFNGDGILVSTSCGSTAYNYALGGAIMSPQLSALQITPIAPSNTSAYRCFRSSVLYPANMTLTIRPIKRTMNDTLELTADGSNVLYNQVKKITIYQASSGVHLIRCNDYDYWTKLKSKLL